MTTESRAQQPATLRSTGDCDLEVGEGAKNETGTTVWYVGTPT